MGFVDTFELGPLNSELVSNKIFAIEAPLLYVLNHKEKIIIKSMMYTAHQTMIIQQKNCKLLLIVWLRNFKFASQKLYIPAISITAKILAIST